MSSFPYHVYNIREAKALGIDVSEYLDINGEVTGESQSIDNQTNFCGDILDELSNRTEAIIQLLDAAEGLSCYREGTTGYEDSLRELDEIREKYNHLR